MVLERAGYTVVAARDGREGVELFQANVGSIALVLLDVAMPGMSGGEAFDRMHAIRPGVRVLVSSGFEETGVLREFSGKPIAGLIPKPYMPAKLVEAIAQILRPGE
jgi:two-component system cell cycle sensor histidine kinase/response regulator CckA